jgi:hypothetical protein
LPTVVGEEKLARNGVPSNASQPNGSANGTARSQPEARGPPPQAGLPLLLSRTLTSNESSASERTNSHCSASGGQVLHQVLYDVRGREAAAEGAKDGDVRLIRRCVR